MPLFYQKATVLQPVLFAILGSLVLSRKQPIFTAVMSVTIVIQVVSTVGDARQPVQFDTFDLHCEQTSWVPNQFIFAQNALIRRMKRNKLVPCWWKRQFSFKLLCIPINMKQRLAPARCLLGKCTLARWVLSKTLQYALHAFPDLVLWQDFSACLNYWLQSRLAEPLLSGEASSDRTTIIVV